MNTDATLRAYEGLAHAVASGYFAPGLERQDLVQEARIGMLKGLGSYDPARGPLGAHLRNCANRMVMTAVKSATRHKHDVLNDATSLDRRMGDPLIDGHITLGDMLPAPGSVEDTVELRETLAELAARMPLLTDLERRMVLGWASGHSYRELGPHKTVDNAMQRGRKKLRPAA